MARKTSIPVHSISDRSELGLEVRKVNRVTMHEESASETAHRDDHYLFVFHEKGTTRLMLDFEELVLEGSTIFCILPGQVHRLGQSADGEGWMIAAEISWVNEIYLDVLEAQVSQLRPLALNEGEASVLRDAMQLFSRVTERAGAFPLSSHIIRNLANTCIGLFAAAYLEKDQSTENAESRPRSITRQFRKLVAKEYKTLKSPAAYAAALNISPSYLNEAVKDNTGFPVSYWIHREITMEARRMLYYTDNNVKEIAWALGYEDPAYFTRLFTKAAGSSPQQFRKDYRK
ncbi:AraC family transcriptional regulator [uncultured Chitinophaga sp.]|uniref:helix-turn-helix domain-containing protein n=1 Tax=uncultured Chitinophaga sp. TaxID=339340 RepID=UPI0025FCF79A|nr:helix-turn-helix transcriptional regulator [uncultured Chitinophaga sp.]